MLENGQSDDDELRDILDDIVQEDHRAGKALERIRHHLDQTDQTFKPVDLNQVILESLELLNSDLDIHNLIVETRLTVQLPLVDVDPIEIVAIMPRFGLRTFQLSSVIEN